jgi:Eukaryotic-type carbonic anhydrase
MSRAVAGLTGGPLQKDHYLLKQFHFHWGDNSCHGSEHRIGEKTFAAEVQISCIVAISLLTKINKFNISHA